MGDGTDDKQKDGDEENKVPQSRFNAVIQERNDARAKLEKLQADFDALKSGQESADSDLASKLAELQKNFDSEVAARKSAELSAMRQRIALENGLPIELAGRLTGETEDDLKKDAESLVGFVKASDSSQSSTRGGQQRKRDQGPTGPTEAQLNDPNWVMDNMGVAFDAFANAE